MIRKNVVIVGVLTGLVALGLSGCGEKPRPAPKPVPIVKKYVPKPVTANQVSITGSARALKRLTVGGANERAYSLSPSGTWLLVEAKSVKSKDRKKIIEKINIQNPNIKMILTPANSASANPVWNPDESSFIFASNRMRNLSIVQSLGVNGGSGVRFLTKNALGDAKNPDVSSDGSKVIFNVNNSITMMDNDGNNMIMYGSGYRPRFSSDDSTILYIQVVGKYRHIYTMSIDGSSMLQLTSENANDYAANWSPDSSHIAFISDRVGGKMHLFVMDRNGGNIIQLTDGNFDITSVEWGDDGYIYFSANIDNNEDIWRLMPIMQ